MTTTRPKQRQVLAILVGAALAAGCGASSDGPRAAATARSKATPTRPRIDVADAVVHVESHYAKRTSEATGFVYDAERGLVMTADHAVEAAPVIHVLLHDGTPLNGRIVGRAQCHDLAILKVTPAPPDLKQVTWGPAVHAGETVRAMTYVAPNGKFHDDMSLIQTRGAVAAVDAQATLTPLLPRFEALIAHQTPLSESSSGSPLVDDAGRVVGVNTLSGRRYGPDSPPGVNYAQSTRSVRALLAQLVPGEHAYFQGWSAEHACHMQMNELAGLPRGTSHHHPVGMPGMEDHTGMGGRDDAQHGHDGMGM